MILSIAVGIVVNEGCKVDNPAFRPLHVREDPSSGERTEETGKKSTASATNSSSDQETGPPSGSSKDRETSVTSSTQPSPSGSSGTLSLTSSEGSSASGTPAGTGTSMTNSSAEATTGTTQDYCKGGASYCYLVDGRDSGNTIIEVRRRFAPMNVHKGSLGPTEPGVPNQAKVFTVSEDGINASSAVRWTPPLAGGIAFDLYAKLPATPQHRSVIFGVLFRMALIVDEQGSVICSFNSSTNSLDLRNTAALTPVDTQWHHYACEYDGENVRLWVDGQSSPKRAAPRPSSMSDIPVAELGGNNNFETNNDRFGHFRGSISAIRIWQDLAAFNNTVSP